MSLQELLNLGKTAQLKICKTLQAEVRALCLSPESSGGDSGPGLSSETEWCFGLCGACLGGMGADSQSAISNQLYAALSPKSYGCGAFFPLGKAWGIASRIHWALMRDSEAWRKAGYCTVYSSFFASFWAFISNEGKKVVAKLQNPFPSREGERSCTKWLYLCTVVLVFMLDMR